MPNEIERIEQEAKEEFHGELQGFYFNPVKLQAYKEAILREAYKEKITGVRIYRAGDFHHTEYVIRVSDLPKFQSQLNQE